MCPSQQTVLRTVCSTVANGLKYLLSTDSVVPFRLLLRGNIFFLKVCLLDYNLRNAYQRQFPLLQYLVVSMLSGASYTILYRNLASENHTPALER